MTFNMLSVLMILHELGLGLSKDAEDVTLYRYLNSGWLFYVISALSLALTFVERSNPAKRRWVYLVLLPPPVFIAVLNIVTPVFCSPAVCPLGYFHAFGFADNSLGEAASIWSDIAWVVTVTLSIYTIFLPRTPARRRQAVIICIAFTLLFSYYIMMRTNRDILAAHSLVLFSPVSLLALMILVYAIYKFEFVELPLHRAGENVMHTMPDALLVVDREKHIGHINTAAAKLLGFERGELSGRPFSVLQPQGALSPLWEVGAPEPDPPPFETALLSARGESLPVMLSTGLLTDPSGVAAGHLIIARDIRDRKKKANELFEHREYLEHMVRNRTKELNNASESLRRSRLILRNLSERLFVAKEEESSRIARELHDELGQILTGLKIDVTLLSRKISKTDQQFLVNDIASLADTTIKRVQTLTKELRPPMLEKLGLVATIEAMVSEFSRRHEITCHLSHEMEREDLPAAVVTCAYRIVQEALDNVVQHAQADSVEVFLVATADALSITVRDDGVGIEQERISAFEALGILGMKERALTLGGEVRFSKGPEKGTDVHIELPLISAKM